ncbi:siderophore ABC transporter substrate-binding protein [Halobacillus sp. A5]|uniref:siderophore ABC transporter substrate-binding protein n=1 Tax=Halobacillus sp. A5 TaxID=2880263 RepID=UPI0020A6D9F1|nr:siderophore ABC transporter substrate-binding protein [Halobacillus sp. A5]MCP3029388.1 siderophore ABC transporter substrate-binding protein [Halobacillus sp. A5]
MKNWLIAVSVLLMVALLAACGGDTEAESNAAEEKVAVKHELGETEVPANPENVVVFDFGIVDSLDELGVDIQGVAKDSLPDYLSHYNGENYENIGGLKEPDFEAISQMDPDVIIISGRQSSVYDELSEIAPTIYLGVDTTKYMDSFQENMNTLGEIFEKEEEVDKQLADIETNIEETHDKASSMEDQGLITLANDGKISAYGEGSRFGLIHDVLGVNPVDNSIESSTHGQSVSFEYISEKDPDYLFVVDRGAVVGGESSAEKVMENELVKKTTAYEKDHIIYLDPQYWYLSGGGLQSVNAMVKEIQESL